jgi:hypothetical protein
LIAKIEPIVRQMRDIVMKSVIYLLEKINQV